MHNDFNKEEKQRWFGDNYECWACGQNHWNCLHHIVGRGSGDSVCESSLLNAAPLNNFNCHIRIHGELRTEVNQKIMLAKTMKFLLKQGYEFTDLDKEFIMKYKKLYD